MSISSRLKDITAELRYQVDQLKFSPPVTHVYNPLSYAQEPHEYYLVKYGNSKKAGIFMGMNPGPWGMAQTGIPFGEISIVKDWLKISGEVQQPVIIHPKRPITGFRCQRSEVSGRRLWGLFKNRFITPETFFASFFVMNYCPLLFFDAAGKNITPDKLNAGEQKPLLEICDNYTRGIVSLFQPKWFVGVGRFAERQASSALKDTSVKIIRILHPSPANPAANRDFQGQATDTLISHGIW